MLPRVLLVAPKFRFLGGQAVVADSMLRAMVADGICVGLLAVDPVLPRGLRFTLTVRYLRTLVTLVFYVASLMREVRKYDVIHVFSASYWSFLVSPTPALLIGRAFKKAVILNYHSGEAEDHLMRWSRIVSPILRIPDRIVVPSRYLVNVFERFGFSAKAIPNVVDEDTIQYKERHGVQPRILVARTLEPEYNIRCTLLAFEIIKKHCPLAEMTILGDGSQRRSLEELTRSLRLDAVTFAGYVKRDRIAWFFNNHDVFLNASSIDNMPISILEAFAAGTPVVTTNAGGIPDMVTHDVNGLLAEIDDHRTLARHVLELVRDPDRVLRLSRAGFEELHKYRWETVGKEWYNVYRDIVGSPAPD